MATPEYVTVNFGPDNRYALHIAVASAAAKSELQRQFESLSLDTKVEKHRKVGNQREFSWAAAD